MEKTLRIFARQDSSPAKTSAVELAVYPPAFIASPWQAVDKLALNDASVAVTKENSEALGPGFRAGFLGMLHMEVFMQRLEQEYGECKRDLNLTW